jgi:hypothetical protein
MAFENPLPHPSHLRILLARAVNPREDPTARTISTADYNSQQSNKLFWRELGACALFAMLAVAELLNRRLWRLLR